MNEETEKGFDADALIDATAPLLGIEVTAAYRPGVVLHLTTAARIVQTVLAIETEDEAEPAPVFRA